MAEQQKAEQPAQEPHQEQEKKQVEFKFVTSPNIERKRPPKYCRFKKFGIYYVDYLDVEFLERFLSPDKRILPRRITGNSKKWQKRVARAVKRARILGLLPFVGTDSIEG